MTIVTVATPVTAGLSDDQQRIARDLASTQAQLEALTDRARQAVLDLGQASQALSPAQAALEQARGRLLGAQAAARQADRHAAAARTVATDAEAAFERSAREVDRSRGEVSGFVAATYRGSGFAAVNAVLESGSPSDLATSVGYLNRAADLQRTALANLTSARMRAKQRSDQADATRVKAEQCAVRAGEALREALLLQTAAADTAASVRAIVDQKTRAAAIVESERAAVLSRYSELQAESDRVAAELRAAARREQQQRERRQEAGVGAGGGAGGRLLMPVNGWKSSDFGMRLDPYYGCWQLHAGVDYAAAGGSPIVAADSGRVVRASWNGGYGNYTCVYHGTHNGTGLSTCYAHQSAILVRTNQWVERGQLIGRVGTTGASTGHHLHFEVRLDGVPTDPSPWLR